MGQRVTAVARLATLRGIVLVLPITKVEVAVSEEKAELVLATIVTSLGT